MGFMCCLAGIASDDAPMLELVIKDLELPAFPGVAPLNVAKLGKLAPKLLLVDIDGQEVDGLEVLRQLRFVLPRCILAVYSGKLTQSWALSCHLAGASCVLSRTSTSVELLFGLREALRLGCYTDPKCTRILS